MYISLQFICFLFLSNRGEFVGCDEIIENIIDTNKNSNNNNGVDHDRGGELIFAQTVSSIYLFQTDEFKPFNLCFIQIEVLPSR